MKNDISLGKWLEMWCKPKEDVLLKGIHKELFRKYSELHRHYHNLDHIAACLEEFRYAKQLMSSHFEVWLAIWFHDVIYDPQSKENEERSRDYAVKVLNDLLGKESMEMVSRLVMATKQDRPAYSKDEKVIKDIDLTILGKSTNQFNEYEESIRTEYAWVPKDNFKKGRLDILKGFLERDSIYQTDYFRQKYEKKARENLRHSISKLKKG